MQGPFDALAGLPRLALLGAGALVLILVLVVILVAVALASRRKKKPQPEQLDLRIDVSKLPAHGPRAEGLGLHFYGVPVRLAALVLAPAGRGSVVPGGRELEQALESLLPGLVEVIKRDQPLVRGWPFQISTQGFTHAFFNHASLPGDRGKGTPWCAIAGRFETGGPAPLLAGLICVADRPNSFGQVAVQQLGQWLDVLRIKAA
jgi:hypothetical protein